MYGIELNKQQRDFIQRNKLNNFKDTEIYQTIAEKISNKDIFEICIPDAIDSILLEGDHVTTKWRVETNNSINDNILEAIFIVRLIFLKIRNRLLFDAAIHIFISKTTIDITSHILLPEINKQK